MTINPVNVKGSKLMDKPIICMCFFCTIAGKSIAALAIIGLLLSITYFIIKIAHILRNCKERERRLKDINNRRAYKNGIRIESGR
jgi:hypothetical protein